MHKIRELIIKAPYICKCREPERVSHIFKGLFDSTKENGNAFDPKPEDFEKPGNRLRFIDLTHDLYEAEDKQAARKIRAILICAMWHSWERKGKVAKGESAKVSEMYAEDLKIENQEIDQIITAKEAAGSWWWLG